MKTHTISFVCFISLAINSLISPALAAPPKDVSVVNTPSVNVTNIPDVNVVGLPSVSLNTDIRTPYHTSVSITDWTTQAVNGIIEVPAGNLFVIEHISASAFMHPQVVLMSFGIYPQAGGTSTAHVFVLQETAPEFTGSNTYAGSYSVRLYTSQSFLVRFSKTSIGGSLDMGTASVAASGYLIPYSSPSLAP